MPQVCGCKHLLLCRALWTSVARGALPSSPDFSRPACFCDRHNPARRTPASCQTKQTRGGQITSAQLKRPLHPPRATLSLPCPILVRAFRPVSIITVSPPLPLPPILPVSVLAELCSCLSLPLNLLALLPVPFFAGLICSPANAFH